MSMKINFMHYMKWIRVMLPVIFEEFELACIFLIFFSSHYHFQFVKGHCKRSTYAKIWAVMRNVIYRKMTLLWDHICPLLIVTLLRIGLTRWNAVRNFITFFTKYKTWLFYTIIPSRRVFREVMSRKQNLCI